MGGRGSASGGGGAGAGGGASAGGLYKEPRGTKESSWR